MADRRPRLIRRIAGGCAVAVALAAGYLVIGSRNSDAATSSLVTATATVGNVTQTASLQGTVQRIDEVSATFPTSGTVTSVKVAVGQSVTEGQPLATMDTTAFKQAVSVAQANLVTSQAALDDAESGTTSTTSTSSTTAASDTSFSPGSPTSSVSSVSSGSSSRSTGSGSESATTSSSKGSTGAHASGHPASKSKVPAVQAKKGAAAVSATAKLLKDAETACEPVVNPPTGITTITPPSTTTNSPSSTTTSSPSSTTTNSLSSTTTSTPTGTPTPPTTSRPTSEQVSACVAAIGKALTSAQGSADTLSLLSSQIEKAATALQEQAATASAGTTSGTTSGGTTSRGTTPGSGSGSSRTGSSGSSRTSGSAGPSGSAGSSGKRSTGSGSGSRGSGGLGAGQSAASLEVTVLKDQQALAAAQQSLAGATLKAPVSGVVGSDGITAGQTASTSDAIVIVGKGAAVLTASASLPQIGAIRTGQAVTVTPAGLSTTVPGAILSVGVVPSSTSTTPTYPVRITVSHAPQSLATNSQATATVLLASAKDAVTVPVSALSGVSSGSSAVQVLADGKTTTTPVTVGAVGQGKAQVTKGLAPGAVVVIADSSQALPTSTTSTSGRGLPGGGFGGGGRFGGGGGPFGGGGGFGGGAARG